MAVGRHPLAARDGSEVEIANWLDDHSRFLLGCTVFRRVSGDDVVATFPAAGEEHGWPAATLTDNGTVYTARLVGGRNGSEYLLAYLGIRQKNGAPGHPQTQGKPPLLAQPTKRPRPMAGASSDRVTHVLPMSRLITMARPEGVGRARTTQVRSRRQRTGAKAPGPP